MKPAPAIPTRSGDGAAAMALAARGGVTLVSSIGADRMLAFARCQVKGKRLRQLLRAEKSCHA